MAKKKEGVRSEGADRLLQDLKQKNLGVFYIIHGEEDYLCRYYFSQIKKQLLDDLTGDFNYHKLTNENFSVELLNDSLETLPMMADRSLIHVDEVDLFSLDGGDTDFVLRILGDIPPHCCLVLTYGEFKPDKRKKKLWSIVEEKATLAEFSYSGEKELIPWITRHFREQGKLIRTELCSYLVQICGRSMTRLQGEITKISAYSGAQEIVREDIDAVVEPTVEAVVFDITDSLAERNFDRAMERLHVIFKLREEPVAVVGAIGSQMRRLYGAKVLTNADELAKVYGLTPWMASKAMTQARRFSRNFCEKAVLLCAETDHKLKSAGEDPQLLLEFLLLQLAQEARND
ncbi:MAG: DNA polymerase III subunit delta [Oscillospiraceae bacterium]|nr:DNA polymerase III subunit delta [Oscillospiraceae bacterium]